MNVGISPVHAKCELFPINNNEHLIVGIDQSLNYYFCSTARSHSDMCDKEGKYYVKNTIRNIKNIKNIKNKPE
jgi:hypothetical protein